MTKRELKYLLNQKPKIAFRLIQPLNSFAVACKYNMINIDKKMKKINNEMMKKAIDEVIDDMINAGNGKAVRQIIKT